MEEVNEEYKKQRAALEKQYELLRAPIWQKRKDIVSGAVEVELEDSESGITSLNVDFVAVCTRIFCS